LKSGRREFIQLFITDLWQVPAWGYDSCNAAKLKNVEQNLDKQSFIQVYKSYVVAISKIEAIENNEIIIQSFRIPISRNYRDEVIDKVVN